MNYPQITIVTPVYNQVNFIEQTIQSVLDQGYPNLEYIIIDGGSTDGTVEVIKKYADRLSYWVSEPDKGMYDAIQKGFALCHGDILGWINADDLYLQKSLFAVASIFKRYPEVNWITSHHTVIDEDGVIIRTKPSLPYTKYFFYLDSSWHGNEIGQESTFWRESLWDKAGGFSPAFRLAGDFELWLRFFQYEPLYVVDTAFAAFRVRADQLSSSTERYYAEADQALEDYPLSESEKKVCRDYKRKLRLANCLRRIKVLDADRIAGLKKFRRRVMHEPELLHL